jgi:hypothetical protein
MFIALRVHAEGRNVTRAVSPLALGQELNAGWHLNVPWCCLFSSYYSFCGYLSSIRARPGNAQPIAGMLFILLEIARHAIAPADTIGQDLSDTPENRPAGPPERSDRYGDGSNQPLPSFRRVKILTFNH